MSWGLVQRAKGVLAWVTAMRAGPEAVVPEESFDFVFDVEMRRTVVGDFAEMESCHRNRNWKAVVVLAGGIIEAMLVDALGMAHAARSGRPGDLLRMSLGELIRESVLAGILTKETEHLMNAVKDHRNLIHPARAKRTGDDRPGPRQAAVARQVVLEVARDLSRRVDNRLTAEALLDSLVNGRERIKYLSELARPMSPVQQVRFLTVVLPAAYWTEAQKRVTFLTATYFLFHPIDEDLKRLLKQAFRVVFDAAPTPARERVLAHYLGLVRTGASRYLEAFEDAFVQDEDLQYLGERDRALATKRLVTRGRLHTPTPTC